MKGRGLFHCVSCVAALFKITKRNKNDVSGTGFKSNLKTTIIDSSVGILGLNQAHSSWDSVNAIGRFGTKKCACSHELLCYGQARWQPDGTLCHSAHSGGGGLSRAKKHALENTARECHIIKTSEKLKVKGMFLKHKKPCEEPKTSNYEGGKELCVKY